MITINYTKKDNSLVTVTPMPSTDGMFGDTTNPNCSAEDCCLVQGARALRSLGENIDIPTLSDDDKQTAIDSILADKDNWEESIVVTVDEVEARIDSIRGYTQVELDKYIEDNTEKDEDNNITSQPTTQEASDFLINKVQDHISMIHSPVTVPSIEEVSETILAEKETKIAEHKLARMILSGFLVPTLTDEWKSQFVVTETV